MAFQMEKSFRSISWEEVEESRVSGKVGKGPRSTPWKSFVLTLGFLLCERG